MFIDSDSEQRCVNICKPILCIWGLNCSLFSLLFPLTFPLLIGPADLKQAEQDETPPRTPTGNAPSSESDIEVSSPSNDLVSPSNDIVVSQEEDERLAKELSLKEAAAHDLSHRPKRRRFHESYNFNMKCPTPGCNSLGESENTPTLYLFTVATRACLEIFISNLVQLQTHFAKI